MKKGLLALIVLLAAGGGYYAWQKQHASAQVHYLTEPVQRGNINSSVLATGSVRAVNRTKVGAQASGELTKLYVHLGQSVKKGELLAEIDSKNQTDELQTAQAKLSVYQSQLKAKETALAVAESTYARYQQLYKQESISQDSFEQAKDTRDTAKAALEEVKQNIEMAKINVATARTNLRYTKTYSPMDGVVVSIPVSIGQTLNAAQSSPTIVQVADLSRMLIKLEIAEGDINKVQAGQKVQFTTLSDPNTRHEAVIDSIDPALTKLTDDDYTESSGNSEAVYYYANAVVDNAKGLLRIGMTTQNTITIASRDNVLVVPNSALKTHGDKTVVSVLSGGKPVEKAVKTGLTDGLNTEIISGLSAGEKVILGQRAEGEAVSSHNGPPMRF